MTHDPMCWYFDQSKIPAAAVNDGWPCICDLIARVREDERMRDDDYAYVATESYAAALRDAIEAVKALPLAHMGWMCVEERNQAVAAIEALGGER